MADIQTGSCVAHDGQAWRVIGLVTATGGAEVAHIECLDRDAFSAIAADKLEVLPMSEEDVKARIADREKRQAPIRAAHALKICRKRLATAIATRDELAAKIAEGEAQGTDAGLLETARVALSGIESRIKVIEQEIAAREGGAS